MTEAGEDIRSRVMYFNLPSQPVDRALTRFAEQVDVTLIFPYDRVQAKMARRLEGKYKVQDAINLLLEGTGLKGSFSDQHVLNISIDETGEKKMEKKKGWLTAIIGLLAGSAATAASAVPVDARASAPLEEVVVTAQKRVERLLDVPMSISAISGEILEDSNITSTGDLGQLTPGLTTVSNGLAFTPAIRGISSSGSSPGDETNVSLYLDDVYIGAPLAGLFDLKDIERVEVLKGPQGTLFGRNATGGAIRIVTRDPAFDPSAEVSANYGFDYDAVKLGTYVTGPLVDSIAASFSGYFKEDKGYVDGISPQLRGKALSRTKNWGARSKIMYDPGSDFKLILIGDYSEREDDRMFNLVPRGGRNVNENHADYIRPDAYELSASTVPIFEVDTWGVSLTADWSPSDRIGIKSITAYREVEGYYQTDTDRSNLSIASLLLSQTQDTLSQEFIFSGDISSRLSWLTGFYYYSSEAAAPFFNSYGGDAPDGPLVFNFDSQVDTTSYAAFGELNYAVAEKLHLTLGARYTDEEKEYEYRNILGATADESESWDNTSYRVVGRYDLSQDANVYLSFSTGFKSGVYNAYGLPTTGPVKPEEIEAWELGAKARVAGITLTGAIFAYEYTDIQVQGQSFLPDGTWVVTLNNAAEAEIEGIELTASGRLTGNLSFNIGYSGLPTAEYSDYSSAQVFIFNEATGGTNAVVPFDATGSRIIRAPKHQVNTQLVYETLVREGNLRAVLSYSYNDGFYWQPGDLTPEDSFDLVNGKISWTDPGDRYTFSVWGENLTDEEYSVYTTSTAAGIADTYAQPRQIGVEVSARF